MKNLNKTIVDKGLEIKTKDSLIQSKEREILELKQDLKKEVGLNQ